MVWRHPNNHRLRILRAWYTKGVIHLPDPEPEHGAAPRILLHPATWLSEMQKMCCLKWGAEVFLHQSSMSAESGPLTEWLVKDYRVGNLLGGLAGGSCSVYGARASQDVASACAHASRHQAIAPSLCPCFLTEFRCCSCGQWRVDRAEHPVIVAGMHLARGPSSTTRDRSDRLTVDEL
jgi:hypothetical protein